MQMEAWLRWRGCLRQKLTAYLNGSLEGGRHGVICHQADNIKRATCSGCARGPGRRPRSPPQPRDRRPPRDNAGGLTLDTLSLTGSSSEEEENARQANP